MSNIESGKRGVKSDELTLIAQALRVSVLAILDESSLLARLPIAARADSGDCPDSSALERLRALAELHEVLSESGLPSTAQLEGVPPVDEVDWERSADVLADWARERLGLPAESDDRFTALAEAIESRLQVDVLVEDHLDTSHAGAAITDWTFPLVFVRSSQPRPRALFTLAHELAHVLSRNGEALTFDTDLTPYNDGERLANAFAAKLLMPTSEVRAELEGGLSPLSLARLLIRFGVSFESLVYRLHNLGYINYQARNKLRSEGLRGLISAVDDSKVAKSLINRLSAPANVEPRPPLLLAIRALEGYRRGVLSIRPLADLLGEEAERLVGRLQGGEDQYAQLASGNEDASAVERYSGSPI